LATEPSEQPDGPRHVGMTTIGVCLAAGMQSMDTFLAGIALPNMMGSFSTTLDEISWILTAYLVAVAVFTPLTAWLGRRYGRKRVLLTGIVGFVTTSTFAGLSDSLTEIVTARFLQGVFGATLIPVAQQILLDAWPRERHNIALGYFSVGMMVGLIIGPVLGGFLTEYYSWRWNFFVNIPGGLTAFTLVFVFVRENAPDPSRRFDLTGFVLLGTALICMQLVLDRGEKLAWFESDEIILWASISGCALYLFIIHIITARRPFVDPALFRNRNFAICATYLILLGIMMFGFVALFPALLQNYLGYPVMTSGLILSPRGIATMFSAIFVGHVLARVGPKPLIFSAAVLMGTSFFFLGRITPDVNAVSLLFWIGIQGVSFGFFSTTLTASAYATLSNELRPDATAFLALSRRIGASIGVSVLVAQLLRFQQANRATLGENISHYNERLRHLVLPDNLNLGDQHGLHAFGRMINEQAEFMGYLDSFNLLVWVCVIAAPIVFLMRDAPAPTKKITTPPDQTPPKSQR
jgi:DHA2 family multidrug resistance protein